MKKRLFLLPVVLFFFPLVGFTQDVSVVWHPRLTAQITANHGVREGSMLGFRNSYKKQKELYEDANKKMVQVVSIHEQIYQSLYNVNSYFKQSRQVKYILEYIPEIAKNASKMVELSTNNPQYAVWINKFYLELIQKSVALKEDFDKILKADQKILVDYHDRNTILEGIYAKLQNINIAILDVINMLNFSKSRAYIYSIPVLGTYISQDKALVETIMQKYQYFKLIKP